MVGKPKPLEQRRRKGRTPSTDSGGRPLPTPPVVVPMLPNGEIPQAPDDLRQDGLDLWRQVWLNGQTWISAGSDRAAVELTCRLADSPTISRKLGSSIRSPATCRLDA